MKSCVKDKNAYKNAYTNMSFHALVRSGLVADYLIQSILSFRYSSHQMLFIYKEKEKKVSSQKPTDSLEALTVKLA